MVDFSLKFNMPKVLEANFITKSNDAFHKIVEKVREETGILDNQKIYSYWEDWLKREKA